MRRASRRRFRPTPLAVLAVCGALAFPAMEAFSQAAPPPRVDTPPSLEDTVRSDDDVPPLLREGTFLDRARGSLVRDRTRGGWLLRIPTSDGAPARELVLLPALALEEMLRIDELAGDDALYEISGRILVYRARNYLLPTVVTLIDRGRRDDVEPARPRRGGVGDAIEDRLRERVSEVPRGVETRQPASDAGDPGLDEGTRLQNRLAIMIRDRRTGSWRVVLKGEGSDGADPSMEVLPCRLLERVEQRQREVSLPSELLVSGEVTRFRGQNYLLPTIVRPAPPDANLGR